MRKIQLQDKEDMLLLSDMVKGALEEWVDETGAMERDIEINTVPFVLKHILASHYVHFFKKDKKTVDSYLDVLRKLIYEYKANDINQELDIDSNKNKAQA